MHAELAKERRDLIRDGTRSGSPSFRCRTIRRTCEDPAEDVLLGGGKLRRHHRLGRAPLQEDEDVIVEVELPRA